MMFMEFNKPMKFSELAEIMGKEPKEGGRNRNLAETIKNNRTEKGITQEQLCEKTGINRNMIGRIERMDYIPTIPQLGKLAEVLGFEADRLFVENNQPTVFTAFRGSKLSDEERAGADHLMEMMLAARQQIMLRKALHHE